MKFCALDVGDVWTGTAISDSLGIIARPYKSILTSKLEPFINELLKKESIATIVVGYPKTMRGTQSEQTKKVLAVFTKLEQQFPTVGWKLWDERLTSKRAAALKKTRTKEDKIRSHSIAAAFILSSYLEFQKN